MSSQKGFESGAIVVIALVAIAVLGAAIISLVSFQKEPIVAGDQAELKKFSSQQELEAFLKESQGSYGGYYGGAERLEIQTTGESAQAPSAQKADDYSTTNIQVQGVDEADIVKNDAKCIYTISGANVIILDAFPAENANIVSTINLSGNSVQEMYVNDDRLVVFGNVIEQYYPYPRPLPVEEKITAPAIEGESLIAPIPYIQPSSFIKIYDVSDRNNPVLKKDLVFNGTYFNSRMIGDYVYVVMNSQPYYVGGGFILPTFSPEQVVFPDIYYFDVPSNSYSFTNIVSVNVKDDNSEIQNKVYLLDYASAMYVSPDNIYLVYQKQVKPSYRMDRIVNEIVIPSAPADVAERIRSVMASDKFYYEKEQAISEIMQEWLQSLSPDQAGELEKKFEEKYSEIENDIMKEYQKSIVHRISIGNGNIEYKAHGEIPGMPINQFSMDQSGDYFRIATTTNNFWGISIGITVPVRGVAEPAVVEGSSGSGSVGSEESGEAVVIDSGPTEPIEPSKPTEVEETTIETTSTVTVEEASSLNHIYVLDMNMNVVGKLENLAPDERIYSARFLGDRIYLVTFRQIDPLFVIDLSDPANPEVLGQLKIPGVSDYLHPYDDNHIIGVGRDATEKGQVTGLKLALFDVSDVANPKEVAKHIIGERGTSSDALYDHKAFLFSKEKNLLVIPVNLAEKDYQQTWQGAFVFNLDLENGFVLKGKVTHEEKQQDPYYYAPGIRRSLYLDDTLYTISDKKIKANDLSDMDEIKEIDLPYTEPYGYYWIK